MGIYKCGYCGEIGYSSTPPRTPCLSGRSSHAWRSMNEKRVCTWRCRKCGAITNDDQTPLSREGGDCPGGGRTHTWDRVR